MLIKTETYKGFTIQFVVLPKIEKFLKLEGVNLFEEPYDKDCDFCKYSFFEITLFRLLGEDNEGLPDKKFGKNFKVVYYQIVDKWIDEEPEGIIEQFVFNKKDVLLDEVVKPLRGKKKYFGVRFKLIKDN